MKAAFSGSLAAGVQTCGEVFFCVLDAYAVECGEDSVTGFFFEYTIEVVKITVKHFFYFCAVNVLAVIVCKVVSEAYDISAGAGVGGDRVGEPVSVI